MVHIYIIKNTKNVFGLYKNSTANRAYNLRYGTLDNLNYFN